jgi:hypothetical protein
MLVERILSIGTIIFASFFLVMSLQFEARESVVINPGAWPLFLTSMMLLLGIVLTIRNFRNQNNHTTSRKKLVEEENQVIQGEDELIYPRNLIFLMATLTIYITILGYLGFILSTILVIMVVTGLFGMNKWINRVVTSILSTAGFIVLFPILLRLPFPRGEGIFRTFSSLFY